MTENREAPADAHEGWKDLGTEPRPLEGCSLRITYLSRAVGQGPAVQAALLRVSGDVDAVNANSFQHALEELVGMDCIRLVLDLSAVDFMSSSGIGALIAVKRLISLREGWLRILRIPPRISEVFAYLGIDAFFDFYEEESEALRGL